VMAQALLGLKHIHEKNFVHRDIKPENLLLSSKKPDANVKIADFGFSKSTRDDHDLWETLGTPPYMAPEIVTLRNEDEDDQVGYGRPVDIWALGICLYILLSGVHPYQQGDDDKMLDMIEEGVWPGWKRESTWSLISEDAKNLVKSMMHPNVKSRLTVNQCLEHPWLSGNCREDDLGDIREAIKSYQAKKKMKGAILGVMATNKMKAGLSGLLQTINEPVNATPANNSSKPVAVIELKGKEHDGYSRLTIKIGQGKDLPPKADIYVSIWCGAQKFKTKSKTKTAVPVWDESFQVNSESSKKRSLEIECFDHDKIFRDQSLGEFKIAVDPITVGAPLKGWFKLTNPKQRKKQGEKSLGEIYVEVSKD